MFISIEGIDGCGKSLMTEKLCSYLTDMNIDHIRLREPGGCGVSEECRDILLNSDYLDPRCEVMLFLASRAELVVEKIKPAMAQGKWVVSDRYADSFFAYQSYGRGYDFDLIKKMNDFACDNVYPHKTFYLNIDVETSLARQTDKDRISSSDKEFFYKIKEGFDALCRKFPERFVKIDASLTPDEVFDKIKENLNI